MKALFVATTLGIVIAGASAQTIFAGPYSTGLANDPLLNPNAPDAGIAGFVGPDGAGNVSGSNNYVNPIFAGWAAGYSDYSPAPDVDSSWLSPERTLGPVTGDNFDIASLGDLDQTEIDAWLADPVNNPGPGSITLTFSEAIANGPGADFAAFENGFISGGGAGVAGQLFAELGYLEVSTNGADFARFPSVSLTEGLVGGYGTVDPTDLYNLVGKHANAYGDSWGTPFDLDDLANHPLVTGGTVDLNQINFVRIVDIPGSGNLLDDATKLIDPTTGQAYTSNHGIYDAWVTWGSGGVDFEAFGVIQYYGKTLHSGWDNTGDAETRAIIDADTTLNNSVTVGALQFNGSYRLDGDSVTLGPNNRGIRVYDVTSPTPTAVIASDLLGSDGVVISGLGTVVFEGAKSYTGETVVDSGVLKGTIGALARDITTVNGTVELVADTTESYGNVVSGTGNLRLSGSGAVVLNAAQTYTGVTLVQAGTLRTGAADTLSDDSIVDVAAGATLDLDGHSDTIEMLSGAGQVTLGGAMLTLAGQEEDAEFQGTIAGAGNLVMAGAATQTLSGANSFTGSVTLQAGVLAVSADTALGNAANPVQFSGGVLRIEGTDMHSTGRALNVDPGGELKLDVAHADNTFDLSTNLSGDITLGLYGEGTVTLSGSNTHTGGVVLSKGTLQIADESQLGPGLLNFNGGTLRITGTSVGALSVPLAGSNFKIDVADAGHTYTVGSEFDGSGSLYKYGPGAMVISSAATRDGRTYVFGGEMIVESSAALDGNTYLYETGQLVMRDGVSTTSYLYARDNSALVMEGNASVYRLYTYDNATVFMKDNAAVTDRLYVRDNSTLLMSDGATVSGTFRVYAGTVAGTGVVKADVAFNGDGILSPGQIDATGTLHFEDVELTLEGATYRFEIDALGADLISGTGTSDTLSLDAPVVL